MGIIVDQTGAWDGAQAAKRGTVKVMERNGYLSLRWSVRSRRYTMALGNARATDLNRRMATRMAARIEDDIATGNFDPSLAKYKPKSGNSGGISMSRLMDKFARWKERSVDRRTLEKYLVLSRRLEEFWGDRPAESIGPEDARKFRDTVLRVKMKSERTINETTTLLSACWGWALKDAKIAAPDPWQELRLRVPPKQSARPFSRVEMDRILAGFRDAEPRIAHYYDFVRAWAFLGARTGEMRALRWRHWDDSVNQIWIGETLDADGATKPTKNQKASVIDLPPWFCTLLRSRRDNACSADDLIFQSLKGSHIEAGNFNNRVWKPMLERLGIEYRRPYNLRHTSISHNIEAGLSEADAANLYRTSIPMLQKNYRGSITNRPVLRDYLSKETT